METLSPSGVTANTANSAIPFGDPLPLIAIPSTSRERPLSSLTGGVSTGSQKPLVVTNNITLVTPDHRAAVTALNNGLRVEGIPGGSAGSVR